MKKKLTMLLAVIGAIIIPTALFAWGPKRDTYTQENAADEITFNSITNNASFGDERNFVKIREFKKGTKYTDSIKLQEGKTYEVFAMYHNNAKAKLHKVAINTRMSVGVPKSVDKKGAKLGVAISADNAKPQKVWDSVWVTADKNVTVNFIKGSATIHGFANNPINGKKLSDNLFTEGGTHLGYYKLDGRVPGCNEYAGFVTFKIYVPKPKSKSDFTISKQVSLIEKKNFTEQVKAQPGAKVWFKIHYKNNGPNGQKDVIIKDQLPTGMKLVKGSVVYANAYTNGKWKAGSDALTTSTGVNIGNYKAGANAYIKFAATVPTADQIKCGSPVDYVNTVKAITRDGSKKDTAKVIVDKPCPKKIKVCELDTKKVITIDEKDFNKDKHSKDLNDCKEQPKKIKVCELKTKKVINIFEKDFDGDKHSKNLDDCKEAPKPKKIKVCKLDTKKIVYIWKSEYNDNQYSTNLNKCISTPVELPETGASLGTLVSLGSLVVSGSYYIASKKQLQ